jgi:hypothetical protein
MEVHAHTHTERKKWTHYLWEFLMLFLAVFCGFLAENQREHFIEHQREKIFMKSMLKDLAADTSTFSGMIDTYTIARNHVDSLIWLLNKNHDLNNIAHDLYKHEVWIHSYYKLVYSDRTIVQLKNSGNFRLIRNQAVSDMILEYDGHVRNFIENMQEQYILPNYNKINDAGTSIFKSSVFRHWMENGRRTDQIRLPASPFFLFTGKEDIERYINSLDQYAVAPSWFIANLRKGQTKARQLDSLIGKEYHLK